MAKIKSTLQIVGKSVLDSGKIDFSLFKNVPSTLVSAEGHNHDDRYYRKDVVQGMFDERLSKIDEQTERIIQLSYKTDLFMGGGFVNNTEIHTYNIDTESTTKLDNGLPFEIDLAPGIPSIENGYFLSESKKVSKFTFQTLSHSIKSDSPVAPKLATFDFAIQSKGYVVGEGKWTTIKNSLDVWSVDCEVSDMPEYSSRNGLSSIDFAIVKSSGVNNFTKYDYITKTVSTIDGEFETTSGALGVSKDSKSGLYISKIGYNFSLNYTSNTISTYDLLQENTDNACSTINDVLGLIATGGTGLKVQKITWSTNSVSLAQDLTDDKSGSSYISK